MTESLSKSKTSDDDLKQFADEWDESLYRSDAVIAGANWEKERIIRKLSWILEDLDLPDRTTQYILKSIMGGDEYE